MLPVEAASQGDSSEQIDRYAHLRDDNGGVLLPAARPPVDRPRPAVRDMARKAHQHELCPSCGASLTMRAYSRASRETGVREFRRCVSCLLLAQRVMAEDDWTPWAIADETTLDPIYWFGVAQL